MPLTEKYRPKTLKEVIGQEEIVRKVLFFVLNYKKQRKKALLFHGAAGTGKTSLVYALASDLGYELIELNASDFRDKGKIDSVLKTASQQKSLFGKGKIILVEEVEGISGYEDRGGVNAVGELILESNFPIILTTNNPWQKKLDKIRSKTELLQFRKLSPEQIERILTKLSEKESIKIRQKLLKVISEKSLGDARAAINDFESLVIMADKSKEISELSPELLGGREKESSVFEVLQTIFKGNVSDAIGIFENSELNTDDFFMWIDENLPEEYRMEELAKAYEILSKADVFRGRIRRRQHWHFLACISALLSAGICSAKKNKDRRFVGYRRPSRILKIWISKRSEKQNNAKRIASLTHCSARKAFQELPYLEPILQEKGIFEQD